MKVCVAESSPVRINWVPHCIVRHRRTGQRWRVRHGVVGHASGDAEVVHGPCVAVAGRVRAKRRSSAKAAEVQIKPVRAIRAAIFNWLPYAVGIVCAERGWC